MGKFRVLPRLLRKKKASGDASDVHTRALHILDKVRSLELRTELARIVAQLDAQAPDEARHIAMELINAIEHPSDVWLHRQWDNEIELQAAALSLSELDDAAYEKCLYDGLLTALDRAKRQTSPFPHFVIDKVFADDLYIALLLASPHISAFKPIASAQYLQEGRFQRYQLPINAKALSNTHRRHKRAWLAFNKAMNAPEIVERLCRNLDIMPPKSWRVHTRLQLDRAGAKIRPHKDGENGGVLTFQMYFPLNKANFDTGTELFTVCESAFSIARKFEYRPNFAYAFQISDKSWHGSKKGLDVLAEGRMSIIARVSADI